MITRKEIEQLAELRKEKNRIDKLEKELTKSILERANGKGKQWEGISFEVKPGHNSYPIKEKIMTLPNWEEYYKTTEYEKIVIGH